MSNRFNYLCCTHTGICFFPPDFPLTIPCSAHKHYSTTRNLTQYDVTDSFASIWFHRDAHIILLYTIFEFSYSLLHSERLPNIALWYDYDGGCYRHSSFNLPFFKMQVYYHLKDRMAWYFMHFSFNFVSVYIRLYYNSLFNYLSIFSDICNCFSLPFPNGCNAVKGKSILVLCPYQ